MAEKPNKKLHLKFHGRLIDQLGFQTYQSPVASIAEIVSNSWDADSKKVEIFLPENLNENSEIIVKDNGYGMTFEECQERYLKVGWGRRGDNPNEKSKENRPLLGRKGIGKFAGFGIADIIRIETISGETGEKTIFEMDQRTIRGNGDYIIKNDYEFNTEFIGPNEPFKENHGTTIILKGLKLGRIISKEQFPKSMARRFLLHETADNFEIFVDGKEIPKTEDCSKIQFSFPKDFEDKDKPEGIIIDKDGWGTEIIDGKEVRWRIFFYEDTIDEEELQGVSIFAKGKLAQKPFLFNLFGGLGGQAGQSYMSGQIAADFIDAMEIDPIAAERQRINWELPETLPLLLWGQKLTKKLLIIWKERRGEVRRKELEDKVAGFSERLEKLPHSEGVTLRKVLNKLGGISSLSKKQYEEIGESILTSWEEGRLKELISKIADSSFLSEKELLEILFEEQILSALNVAEAAKSKLFSIVQLKERIEKKDLENAVRNYLAENPWIISPKWETFKVETSLNKIAEEFAEQVGFKKEEYNGRIDLILKSGSELLVLEFMRPGLKIDYDHLSRFEYYIRKIKNYIQANSVNQINIVTGYLVADKIDQDSTIISKVISMKTENMFAQDWNSLLGNAITSWKEFLKILVDRGKGDERLVSLLGNI